MFRILGIIDILVAYAVIAKDFNLLGIGIVFAAVLLIKGLISLPADWTSRLFGFADIAAAFILLFQFAPFPFDIVIFLVLLYKGILSLF
ncbi:MAG: hypothetical protein HYW25_00140 [Candidatus Aenigmarchaeota archaeon]|nr:hypothetical protein [Candidatus Aenigmarchaeota archaeon]